MPLVSVIVPVYNALSTLPRCVNSVLGQSLADFELLLVDDGSPDASGALCDAMAMADARIRVIHKRNGGVSSARNAGLDEAKGKWVIFLDADDYLCSLALEVACSAAESQTNRIFFWYPASEGSQLCSEKNVTAAALPFASLASLQFDHLLPMPWNKIYNLSLIQKSSLRFDTNYTLGEDLLFCMDYITAFKAAGGEGFALLKTFLTFYDQSCPDSLTRKLRPDFYPLWQGIYAKLLALCEGEFACSEEDNALLRQSMFGTFAAGICDLMQRGTGSARKRRKALRAILKSPWLRQQRKAMAAGKVFSLYEPAVLLASPQLVCRIFRLFQNNYHWFLQLQYTGTALRKKLHRH